MATETIEEWQSELQKQDGGLVATPQLGSPAQMAPPARLTWLRTALAELSLPTDFLAPAEALVERARGLRARGSHCVLASRSPPLSGSEHARP